MLWDGGIMDNFCAFNTKHIFFIISLKLNFKKNFENAMSHKFLVSLVSADHRKTGFQNKAMVKMIDFSLCKWETSSGSEFMP